VPELGPGDENLDQLSTIEVHRKDLSARLNDVDIPTYCECFHRSTGFFKMTQVGSSSRGSWTDKNSSVHPQLLDSLLEAARGGRRTGRAG